VPLFAYLKNYKIRGIMLRRVNDSHSRAEMEFIWIKQENQETFSFLDESLDFLQKILIFANK